MLGAAKRTEGLTAKVPFTLIAEPEKELLHPVRARAFQAKETVNARSLTTLETLLICFTQRDNECGSLGSVPGPG